MSGSRDLDISEAHDRIDLDGVRLGALAHDLAMDLAVRRYVDDDVARDLRLASEPAAVGQRAALGDIARLHRVPGGDVVGARLDAVLGERAFADLDLAAAADAAAAADGIEIDAELARGLEDACALGEAAALAGGREDDELVGHDAVLSPAPGGGLRGWSGWWIPRRAARGTCGSRSRNWDRAPSPHRRRGWPGYPRDAADS